MNFSNKNMCNSGEFSKNIALYNEGELSDKIMISKISQNKIDFLLECKRKYRSQTMLKHNINSSQNMSNNKNISPSGEIFECDHLFKEWLLSSYKKPKLILKKSYDRYDENLKTNNDNWARKYEEEFYWH